MSRPTASTSLAQSKVRIGTILGKPAVIGNPNLVGDDELLIILDSESDDILAIKQRGSRVTGNMDADGFETISSRDGADSGGGVNINVSQLNVANNGTYTAPTGSAYSPVIVNVQVRTQTKTITPTEEQQVITPDNGYDGISQVTVGAIQTSEHADVVPTNQEQTITASAGTYFKQIVVTEVPTETLNVELQNTAQVITPSSGHFFNQVNVPAVVDTPETQVKEVTITENGSTSVTPDIGKVLTQVDIITEIPLEANKTTTIDISEYSEPIEINPTSGKTAMEKATVTLTGLPEITYDAQTEMINASNIDFNLITE